MTTGNTVLGDQAIGSYMMVSGTTTTVTAYVATVPEPSTPCMALAGLACGGYSAFRRRPRA